MKEGLVMKRYISLLLFLIVLMVSSAAFAAYKPDPADWQWVDSNDTTSVYVRNSSIVRRYDGSIDAEICYVTPNEGQYSIHVVRFLPSGKSTYVFRIDLYNDTTHKLIKKYSGIIMSLMPVLPNTFAESGYKYVKTH